MGCFGIRQKWVDSWLGHFLRLCDLGQVISLSVSVSLAEYGDNMINSQDLIISYI